MKVAMIKWRDAVAEEADTGPDAKANLATLVEVGFLLDENEEAVQIGMENHERDDDVTPGRWRLSIPRVNIKEMYVMDIGRAFPKKGLVWRS